MISVFTAGMSSPDSTMLVDSRMSYLPSPNSVITRSSSVGARRPCASTMRASGTIARSRSAMRPRSSTRGTTQKTCPPRNRSRWIASRATTPSNGMMKVRTASRSTGGVAIRLISRTPVSASCSVRGMGVADSVSTCTSAFSAFSFSLWETPKCCSSSTISRPRSANSIPLASRAWVPTTMLTLPSASPRLTSAASFAVTMRLSWRDLHRQAVEPLAERAVVLPGQQRGGHHDGHLGAAHGGDEGGAQGDLGLAEADVAADQPVHRPAGGQVLQHVGDGARLVLRLGEREAGAELVPGAFRRRQAGGVAHPARGGGADQLARHVLDALLHARLAVLPRRTAQLVQRGAALGAEAAQHLDVLDRQEQLVVAVVQQPQAVVRRARTCSVTSPS